MTVNIDSSTGFYQAIEEPKVPRLIPFHEARGIGKTGPTIVYTKTVELPEARSITITSYDGGERGFDIRRRDADGNISVLKFGLNKDAQLTLTDLLVRAQLHEGGTPIPDDHAFDIVPVEKDAPCTNCMVELLKQQVQTLHEEIIEWKELLDTERHNAEAWRYSVGKIHRLCNAHGIAPGKVCDRVQIMANSYKP